ncbi:MAG: hypothetical protein PHP28_10405 [Actinomycetota bacterium]|nr:hypothetical protein [Actinomycetota bacterium]
MGLFDLFRKRPGEQAVVFAGGRIEAELVMGMLREEGFHPREWADLPAPAYAGPIGAARIVVPPEEGGAAKAFLADLERSAREAEGDTAAAEATPGADPESGEGAGERPSRGCPP